MPSIETAPRAAISMLVALREYLRSRGDARASSPRVTAEAFLASARVPVGGEVELAIRVTIADGWHINAAEVLEAYLEPTVVTLGGEASVVLAGTVYPPPRSAQRELSAGTMPVYTETVWIRCRLQPKHDASLGRVTVPLEVHVQPCGQSECLAPSVLDLPLEVTIAEPGAVMERMHAEVFDHLEAGEWERCGIGSL